MCFFVVCSQFCSLVYLSLDPHIDSAHACMEELSIFYIIIPSALLVLLSTGAAVLLSYWNHAHGRGGYSLTDMPA